MTYNYHWNGFKVFKLFFDSKYYLGNKNLDLQ